MEATNQSTSQVLICFLFNSTVFFLESKLGKRKHIFQSQTYSNIEDVKKSTFIKERT